LHATQTEQFAVLRLVELKQQAMKWLDSAGKPTLARTRCARENRDLPECVGQEMDDEVGFGKLNLAYY
jgi:hypothetical protein